MIGDIFFVAERQLYHDVGNIFFAQGKFCFIKENGIDVLDEGRNAGIGFDVVDDDERNTGIGIDVVYDGENSAI